MLFLSVIACILWVVFDGASRSDDSTNTSVKSPAIDSMKDSRPTALDSQQTDALMTDGAVQQSVRTYEECLARLHAAISEADRQAATAVTEDIRQQIAKCREANHNPAAALRELYGFAGPVQERTLIILALKELDTPEAITALSEIALEPGRDGSTLGPRAVQALAAMTSDADHVSTLLASESPRTRDEAAMALQGNRLTEASVRRLGELLSSDSWVTHNLVATAFATDQSADTAKQKAHLLLAALPQLDRLADVPPDRLPFGSTSRDVVLNSYVFALAHMPGAGTLLREELATVRAGSVAHDILVLALALRGDGTAYSSVLKLAQDHPNGFVRSLAVTGLGIVGSTRDIAFLESVESNDPYTALSSGRDPGEVIHPVRLAAKSAIEELREKMTDDR